MLDTLCFTAWTLWQYGPSRSAPVRTEALQQRRLRRLLRHAVTQSPFYREKYRGLDVRRCRLADLPITTKGELMAGYDDCVTDPAVRQADVARFVEEPRNSGRLYLGRYSVSHTSGSQGQPLLIVQSPLCLDLFFAFQMTRGNTAFRLSPLEPIRRVVYPARLAVLANAHGFFPSAAAWGRMPAAFRRYVRTLFVDAFDPDVVDQLNAFQPTVLTGYPSGLLPLVLQADRLRLAPGLTQVVTNSEMLTETARAGLQEALGVPVLDNYATGECLFLANGCRTRPGAHVNADWVVLEVVDVHNRPVPPGQTGHKVLLTNLANRVLPFIRYEVGDRVQMATEPCGCGNRLPRVERVEGRSAEVFWVQAGSGYRPFTSHVLSHAFEYLREVREWQASQQERNRILVRLELLPGAELDRRRAWARVREALHLAGFGDVVNLEIEVVPRLAPDPRTGKFRRLVSQVGAPTDAGLPQTV